MKFNMNGYKFIASLLGLLIFCSTVEAQRLPRQRLLYGHRVRQQQATQKTQIEVGNTVAGSGSASLVTGSLRASGKFTVAQSGSITKISIYSSNSSADNDFIVGIYTDSSGSPSSLVGYASFENYGTWDTGWKDFDLEIALLSAGTYWIVETHSASASFTIYRDGLTGGQKSVTLAYGDALPDPFGTPTTLNYNLSFKALFEY